MAKRTLDEMRLALRRKLRDPAGREAAFHPEEIFEILVDTLREWQRSRPLLAETTFPTEEGTRRYDAPAGALRIYALEERDTTARTDTPWAFRHSRSGNVPDGEIVLDGYASDVRTLTVVYGVAHTAWTVDDPDGSATLYETDEDLFLDLAKAEGLDRLAGDAAKYFRWSRSIAAEDRVPSGAELAKQAEKLRERTLKRLRMPAVFFTPTARSNETVRRIAPFLTPIESP